MTRQQMEVSARNIMERAQGIIRDCGSHAPVLLMVIGPAMTITQLDMGDKDKVAALVPAMINKHQPDIAFLVTDSWKKSLDNKERIGEMLTVFAASEAGTMACVAEYTRDEEGKPVFGDVLVSDHAESRFFEGVTFDFPEPSPTVH